MAERRPIASRDTGWAQSAARWLAMGPVTPNQISMASVLFAAMAGAAFWYGAEASDGLGAALFLLAALGCQLRLICNLLDGMVAIEGGKSTKDGPFWNEAPDRLADILILGGAGLAADTPGLGFAAAALAILTAYIRELGRAESMDADFSGPMAKPHRMAVMTLAALIGAAEQIWMGTELALQVALVVIVLGAAFTALRRSARLIAWLKAR